MNVREQRRREAAARVAALHRPLAEIFADLRAEADAPSAGGVVEPPPEGPAAESPAEGPPAVESVPEGPPAVESPAEGPPAPEPADGAERAPDPELHARTEGAPAVASTAEGPPAAVDATADEAATLRLLDADVAAAFRDVLDEVAREWADDDRVGAEDVALRLALAAEQSLGEAAAVGARAAGRAGVPSDGEVAGGADGVPEALVAYAEAALAALAAGDVNRVAGEATGHAAHRAVQLARSAGVAARVVAAGTPWRLVQRFGEPYCPNPGCYGLDGRELDPTGALPPYADHCNCTADPAR